MILASGLHPGIVRANVTALFHEKRNAPKAENSNQPAAGPSKHHERQVIDRKPEVDHYLDCSDDDIVEIHAPGPSVARRERGLVDSLSSSSGSSVSTRKKARYKLILEYERYQETSSRTIASL